MQMSLLDIAVKKSGETPETSDGSDKKTLIFVGNKAVGKTSLIQRFLEKNDPIKETIALEYSFARKSGRSLSSNGKESVLIIVLDLSSPKTLWITLEILLQTAYNHLTKAKDDQLEKSSASRVPPNHEDQDSITPFPCPLILIGGKYDLFLNLDPEEKKVICRSLRLVAHSLAASLFFYSDKDPNLVKKSKDLLNYYGFGGSGWKGLNVDMNKPLSIPCGMDSFEQIAANITISRSSGLALERFKHAFVTQFPQETETYTMPDDPAKNLNFREPIIDELRTHKNEELDRLVESNNRRKVSTI